MNTENPMEAREAQETEDARETPLPAPAGQQEAASGGDSGSAPASGIKIPRNAPCPCGSGRKYKKCCGADSATRARAAAASDLPDGVQSLPDPEQELFFNASPKWRMYIPEPVGNSGDFVGKATGKVIDGLVRPFAAKYCSLSKTISIMGSEIAVLQTRLS